MVEAHKDVPEPTTMPKHPSQLDVEDEINTFPGSREYLGTIQTASGSTYKVYMPVVYDYACIDMSVSEGVYRLGAKSIGISYLAFQVWSFPDAQLVMGILSNAIDTLYTGRRTTHE